MINRLLMCTLLYLKGMASLNKRAAIKKLRNLVFTPKSDLSQFRESIEKQYTNLILPNMVDCRPVTVHGIPSDMLIPQVSSNRRMILYVHGGSFMGGSRVSWRNFCASLANEAASRVLVPDFRLSPEYAFPAAVEDISAVYKRMCDHHVDVFFAGDGSGASIALGAALSIPKSLSHYFKGVLLFSPWVDLSNDSAMYKVKTHDPLFTAEYMRYCAAYYTFSSNFENPMVSPLKADLELFKGFPPVYIQMGSDEIIKPSVRAFYKKMIEAGVNCRLDIRDGLFHFFQFVHDEVPEAHKAVEEAGIFIKTIENSSDYYEEDDLWN